ncbi:MAG: hypothetical protein RBT74_12460 [Tenuifilaceae bacterium]|nr:hypothetical protein [Tenuifilaceae bacterium]
MHCQIKPKQRHLLLSEVRELVSQRKIDKRRTLIIEERRKRKAVRCSKI